VLVDANLPLFAVDEAAWEHVSDWLSCDVVWIPGPRDQHGTVLGSLIRTQSVAGNLTAHAQLAALGVEHGLTICSADTDFSRFWEVRCLNPLTRPGRPSR
jgi:uncharacterized protein